jgi:hypothetical protein
VLLPEMRPTPELQVRLVVLLVQVLICHTRYLDALQELVLLLHHQPVQHWLVPPWLVLQLPLLLLLLHLLLVLHKNQRHYQARPPSRLPKAPHQLFSHQLLPQLPDTVHLQLICLY